MKKVTKLVLMLSLAGPSVLNLSCTSTFWRSLRDAAFDGVAAWVQTTTFDTLDGSLNLGD